MVVRLHSLGRPRADVRIRTASRADLEWVEQHARPEDKAEIEAAGQGASIVDAPRPRWVAVAADDERLCVFGCWKDLRGIGHAWLIGTPRMTKLLYAKALMRLAPEYIAAWKKSNRLVANVVMAENVVHVKWLKRLGAQMADPVTINGHQFIPFVL